MQYEAHQMLVTCMKLGPNVRSNVSRQSCNAEHCTFHLILNILSVKVGAFSDIRTKNMKLDSKGKAYTL